MLYRLMSPAVLTKFFQELNGDFASLHKMPSDGLKLQCSVMLAHISSDITPHHPMVPQELERALVVLVIIKQRVANLRI